MIAMIVLSSRCQSRMRWWRWIHASIMRFVPKRNGFEGIVVRRWLHDSSLSIAFFMKCMQCRCRTPCFRTLRPGGGLTIVLLGISIISIIFMMRRRTVQLQRWRLLRRSGTLGNGRRRLLVRCVLFSVIGGVVDWRSGFGS